MRTIFTTTVLSLFCLFTHAQNVGIGTTTPKARLHVADSNALFTGPASVPASTNYNPPIQGAGTRMMWYPQKAAFRVGNVEGTQWDKANIGSYSFASGFNNTASGQSSTALGGYGTTASGVFSTTMGYGTIASAYSSIALGEGSLASGINSTAIGKLTVASGITATSIGRSTTASGEISVAMGLNSTASGDYSTAMGYGTNTSGNSSAAIGYFNTASGFSSIAMGAVTNALGNISFAIGNQTTAKSFAETVIGTYNSNYTPQSSTEWNASDRLFVIGNGNINTGTASDAMVVLKNGNIGIGTATPTQKLDVAGKTKTTTLQITTGAANGNILISDINGNASWQAPAVPVNYWTASGDNIYKNNAGNVGIGTSNPLTAKLVISGTAGQEGLDLSSTDQYANLRVIRNSLASSDKDMYIGLGSGATSTLHLFSNNAETFTLEGGNVGIGTIVPHAPLQFSNNPSNRKIVLYEDADNDHQFNGFGFNAFVLRYQVNKTGDDHVFYAGTSSTTSNELFRIKGNGNVGVGNGTPTSTLDVNGTIATKVNYRTSNSGNITLDNSGTVWIFSLNIGANVLLPDPFSCPNRRYIIANRNNAALPVTNYYNLSGTLVSTIPAVSSIELVSGGASWEQIK